MSSNADPLTTIISMAEGSREGVLSAAVDLATHRAADALVAYAADPKTSTQLALEKAVGVYDLLIDASDVLNDIHG